MAQLLALYADPESHSAQCYGQTDIRTDGRHDDMPIADHKLEWS